MNILSKRPPRALSKGPGDPNDEETLAFFGLAEGDFVRTDGGAHIAGPSSSSAKIAGFGGPVTAGETIGFSIGGGIAGLFGALLFFTTSKGISLPALLIGGIGGTVIGYLMVNDLKNIEASV